MVLFIDDGDCLYGVFLIIVLMWFFCGKVVENNGIFIDVVGLVLDVVFVFFLDRLFYGLILEFVYESDIGVVLYFF